jgi:hypothetical protein
MTSDHDPASDHPAGLPSPDTSAPGGVPVSQTAHASGLARIFQAAGDMVVYEAEAPYRITASPAMPVAPSPETMRAQPSMLLRAANALIAFTGRIVEQDDPVQWRDNPATPEVAVRLIHGPGGQGKTRLAGHLARVWTRQGWVVWAAHHRRDRSAPGSFLVPDLTGVAGVLIVADYAERWDTTDLLSRLTDTTIPGVCPSGSCC